MEDQFFKIIIYFTLMSGFIFYTAKHASSFQGSSTVIHAFFTLSGFLGTITTFTLVAFFMYTYNWYTPILVWVAGIVISTVLFVAMEKFIGFFTISTIGALSWPIFAYLAYLEIASL